MKIGSRAQIRPELAKIWKLPSPAFGRVTAGDPWGKRDDVVTFELEREDAPAAMRERLIERGINIAHLVTA